MIYFQEDQFLRIFRKPTFTVFYLGNCGINENRKPRFGFGYRPIPTKYWQQPVHWETSNRGKEWARILHSHSYSKGLGSLSHYPGPAGLAGTLPEHPSSCWPVLSMVFPAARMSALIARPFELFKLFELSLGINQNSKAN